MNFEQLWSVSDTHMDVAGMRTWIQRDGVDWFFDQTVFGETTNRLSSWANSFFIHWRHSLVVGGCFPFCLSVSLADDRRHVSTRTGRMRISCPLLCCDHSLRTRTKLAAAAVAVSALLLRRCRRLVGNVSWLENETFICNRHWLIVYRSKHFVFYII